MPIDKENILASKNIAQNKVDSVECNSVIDKNNRENKENSDGSKEKRTNKNIKKSKDSTEGDGVTSNIQHSKGDTTSPCPSKLFMFF